MADSRFAEFIRALRIIAGASQISCAREDGVILEMHGRRMLLMEQRGARGRAADQVMYLIAFGTIPAGQRKPFLQRLMHAHRRLPGSGPPCFTLHDRDSRLLMTGAFSMGLCTPRRLSSTLFHCRMPASGTDIAPPESRT